MKRFLVIGVVVLTSACAGKPTLEPLTKNNQLTDGHDGSSNGTGNESGAKFLRSVSVSSNTNELRPTVKVVLIIDNSQSMQDEQTLLAEGIERMTQGLKGKKLNIDFHVYTTSQTSTDASKKPVSLQATKYQVPSVSPALVTYRPSAGNPVAHKQFTTYDLRPSVSASSTTPLKIRATSSDEEFNNVAAALKSVTSNIGTNGNDSEEGLCSLARLLAQNDPAKNGILQEGDTAAIIYMSDANDNSTIEKCIQSQDIDFDINLTRSYSALAVAPTFNPTLLRLRFAYENDCTIDGQTRRCSRTFDTNYAKTHPGLPNVPDSRGFISCPTSLDNFGKSVMPPAGNAVYKGNCSYLTDSTTRQSRWFSYTDSSPDALSKNLCDQPFNVGGTGYADVTDYFHAQNPAYSQWTFQSCSSAGSYRTVKTETKLVKDAIATDAQTTLEQAIVYRANQLFGNDGYFISAIYDDPDFDKTGCGREAYGTKFKSFITSLADLGYSHPICDNEYFPALEKIEDFVQKITDRAYSLELAANEEIRDVFVTRNNVESALGAGSFSIQAGKITFEEGVIQVGDSLRFDLYEK